MTARRFGLRATTFALVAGLYLLLSGQTSTDECVAAVLIAALATLFAETLFQVSERAFAFRHVGWLRVSADTLARLARETAAVGGILASRHPGAGGFTRQNFTTAAAGDQARAGQRAVQTLATSLTPRSFVIGVLAAHDQLLLHRQAPPPADGT